jgi:Lumazine binding domain
MIGTCLTVTEYDGTKSFKVGIAPETLRRTNLGELKVGRKVNLERAVAGHIRFGGHFVQVPPSLFSPILLNPPITFPLEFISIPRIFLSFISFPPSIVCFSSLIVSFLLSPPLHDTHWLGPRRYHGSNYIPLPRRQRHRPKISTPRPKNLNLYSRKGVYRPRRHIPYHHRRRRYNLQCHVDCVFAG